MSQVLKIILIIVCVLTSYYTLRKIRKSQMQIEDSLFWILISIVLVIISIFPQIADYMAKFLGIGATVNFVFLAMIFILLIKVFMLSLKISQLEEKIKNLVQRIAIKEYEKEEILKKLQQKKKEEIT